MSKNFETGTKTIILLPHWISLPTIWKWVELIFNSIYSYILSILNKTISLSNETYSSFLNSFSLYAFYSINISEVSSLFRTVNAFSTALCNLIACEAFKSVTTSVLTTPIEFNYWQYLLLYKKNELRYYCWVVLIESHPWKPFFTLKCKCHLTK